MLEREVWRNMESCDIRYCDNREAIKALEQQSQNEVIISAKAWDELPAEAKAKMMMALRGTTLRVAACDIGHLPATKCDIPMPKCKRPKIKAIPKEDVVAMFNELLAYTEQYEESDLIKVKYIRQFVFDKFNSLDAHE